MLAAMRRNPKHWRLADPQTVARQHGLDGRHRKNSHCIINRSDGRTLPVPAHQPIKRPYVRKFVELINGA